VTGKKLLEVGKHPTSGLLARRHGLHSFDDFQQGHLFSSKLHDHLIPILTLRRGLNVQDDIGCEAARTLISPAEAVSPIL
jgi:hypothetical protein